MKKNSFARGLLAGSLSLALVIGSLGMTAMAEEITIKPDGENVTEVISGGIEAGEIGLYVYPIESNVDVTVEGDITGSRDNTYALIETYGSYGDGSNVTIQAGNLSGASTGIQSNVNGGTYTTEVGDISNVYIGIETDTDNENSSNTIIAGDITANYTGVDAGVWNGEETIQVGNINAGVRGADFYSSEGTMTAEVGDVTAGAYGVVADAYGENATVSVTAGDITITGDVNVSSMEGEVRWISQHASEDLSYLENGYGVGVETSRGGVVDFTAGNIDSAGQGMFIYLGYSSETAPGTGNISVGNVTADGTGIAVMNFNYGGRRSFAEYDVLVNGTISAGSTGIEFISMDSPMMPTLGSDGNASGELVEVNTSKPVLSDAIELTVWKIDLNERGNVAENVNIDLSSFDPEGERLEGNITIPVTRTAATDFEKKINYIIKLEQPEAGGTLEATDADGNALAKSHDFDVANEGDTVLLKVNLDEGYEILGAYNGDGEKVALLQDANGNYYVAVPKGGGVYLSVELGEASEDDPVDPTPTPGPVNPWVYSTYEDPDLESMTYSEYVQFNEEVRDLVLKAGQGETVVVTTKRWMSFYSLALDALKERPDVTLIVQYRFAGKDFQFVIQAGTDCEALKNEEGYVGFLYFSEKLGVKAVTE